MKADSFFDILGCDFYTGVPDSLLRNFCDHIMNIYGTDPRHHIIAANEGCAVGLAAGYHLATGKVPAVYLQNSGIGNIINPAASLLNDNVYGIPCLFIVGWRGEPGVKDEPQHVFQGKVTLTLLEDMDISTFTVDGSTTEDRLSDVMIRFRKLFGMGKQAALVIRKGAIESSGNIKYGNDNILMREEIIRRITAVSGEDPIICTTGKASRELFEIRENGGQPHCYDFLTVGSMGHSSSVALGIALQRPDKKIWVIDGDGAVLMHMGALAVIGDKSPNNMIHIVINNGSHETVGGQPTVMGGIDLCGMAKALGYKNTATASDMNELDSALIRAREMNVLSFIEVRCAVGARADLGRPTSSAADNKKSFMEYLSAH